MKHVHLNFHETTLQSNKTFIYCKKKKRERALCLDTIYQNNNNYKEDFTTQHNLEFAWYDTFLGHTFSLNKEKGNL